MPIGAARAGVVSGGDAIPDSAVYWWDPETFTTGDSTWTEEVQSEPMSITGDPQLTTLADGSAGIKADGIDDIGFADISPEFIQNTFSIEFVLEYTDSSSPQHILGADDDDGPEMFIALNEKPLGTSTPGQFSVVIEDAAINGLYFAPSSDPGLDDGQTHRVSIIINDLSQSSASIIIDGQNYAVDYDRQENPAAEQLAVDSGFWGRNSDGTNEFFMDGALGVTAFHNTAISSQTI